MAKRIARIIQISDMHLFANKQNDLLGVKTEESLQAVLNIVRDKALPCDAILLTGDLSQDSSKEAYKRLAEIVSELQVPVYWVAGNHDDPMVLEQVYPIGEVKNDKNILFKNWQLILLNSQKEGAVHGYINQKELQFLKKCLDEHPKHHSIIIFHHQPVPVGAKWLDNLGVQNAEEFWQIVKQHQNVSAILFGHVHQDFKETIYNIDCYATPSTCIQFKRNQDHFGLENLPPGFRWVDLYDDGTIKTDVERAPQYVGRFDTHAKGY